MTLPQFAVQIKVRNNSRIQREKVIDGVADVAQSAGHTVGAYGSRAMSCLVRVVPCSVAPQMHCLFPFLLADLSNPDVVIVLEILTASASHSLPALGVIWESLLCFISFPFLFSFPFPKHSLCAVCRWCGTFAGSGGGTCTFWPRRVPTRSSLQRRRTQQRLQQAQTGAPRTLRRASRSAMGPRSRHSQSGFTRGGNS